MSQPKGSSPWAASPAVLKARGSGGVSNAGNGSISSGMNDAALSSSRMERSILLLPTRCALPTPAFPAP